LGLPSIVPGLEQIRWFRILSSQTVQRQHHDLRRRVVERGGRNPATLGQVVRHAVVVGNLVAVEDNLAVGEEILVVAEMEEHEVRRTLAAEDTPAEVGNHLVVEDIDLVGIGEGVAVDSHHRSQVEENLRTC